MPSIHSANRLTTLAYLGTIPQDLLAIYREMNGAALFFKNKFLEEVKIFFLTLCSQFTAYP